MIEVRDKKTLLWKNSKVFSEVGNFYLEKGYYCADPWLSPAWYDFWDRESERCRNGYKVGDWKITGGHYFYLNYVLMERIDFKNAKGNVAKKVQGLPDFWDGDYEYFWCREIARDGVLLVTGATNEEIEKYKKLPKKKRLKELERRLNIIGFKHFKLLLTEENLLGGKDFLIGKARRRGFSYKNASIGARNFFLLPSKLTLYIAYEKKYLYPGIKTIFGKTKSIINHVNAHTAWRMPSDEINKQNHIKASYIEYIDGQPVPKGLLSEIEAISFKDNPDAGRGADGYDIIGEEVGAWGTPGGLKSTIAAMRSSTEAGMYKVGMMTLFGCVCKGTKVYLPTGAVCNIEDINTYTGIVGYAGKGVIDEKVLHVNPPQKKECVRIETINGDFIECSTDHPLLWSKSGYNKYSNGKTKKTVTFKRASDIKVGEQLMMLKQMPKFGNKVLPYARLIGLLIGDGYYGSINGRSTTPQLAINDKGVFDYIKSTGLKYKVYKSKGSYSYIGISKFKKILEDVGIYGQSKDKKRLPKKLYEYDLQSVADLIGGYFDADGNVNIYKKKNTISIRLTSVVKPLLEEVREGLRRFGVISSIIKRKHNKGTVLKSSITGKTSIINTEISYSLEITDRESIKSFIKYIKLTDTTKKKRLENFDCTVKGYKTDDFNYEKTIKGEYFIDKEINGLVPRYIKKITPLGLKDVYNLGTETSHTYITNSFISHNTSGDVEKGTADFADLHSRPGANNFLQFHDTWGKDEDTIEGFFFPKQLNTEGFYDENGNSDIEGSKKQEIETRKRLVENGATSIELIKRMQEEPLNSEEAFGSLSYNKFPILELKTRLRHIKNNNLNGILGTPVELVYENSTKESVKAKPILRGKANPIISLKDLPLDLKGCPVIYEYPIHNPPYLMYKIGYDPVLQEDGTSLTSIIVYKSYYKSSRYYNTIVAEYIGRMDTPEEVDELALKFSILYNTQVMFENNVPGTKNYFLKRKKLHRLASQPDRVIAKNIKNSKTNRVYGCHMNAQLKAAAERYTLEWLKTVQNYDNSEPITVIDQIPSTRLLEELIAYDPNKGNYDLVSSLFMCLIQKEEEPLEKEYRENRKNSTAQQLLNQLKNS